MRRIHTIKIAATIEPPPLMVDSVFDAISEYIENQSSETVNLKIPIKTDGWKYEIIRGRNIKDLVRDQTYTKAEERIQKYKSNIDMSDEDVAKIMEISQDKIDNINLRIVNGRDSNSAEWDDKSNTMTFFVDPREESDDKSIYGDIRHELRHFTQRYLSMAVLGEDEGAGKPSRKISTPEFKQKSDVEEYRQHSMDDSEFYTNLGESIERGQQIISDYYGRRNGKSPLGDMVKMIMEEDYFFNNLKKFDQGAKKFNKATSEFYKAMQKAYENAAGSGII